MEVFLKLLQEIDNMYIVNITSGHFVSTGSFIANDIDGNQYFAHSSIVERYQNMFNSLKENIITSFWVLVEKQNWGANWENREVKNIKIISEDKEDCRNLKSNFFYNLIIKNCLVDLQKMRLEAINVHNVNKEIPYSKEIEILLKILANLNNK